MSAYRALLDTGLPAASIVVAGDSAGGGLSLTTALNPEPPSFPYPLASGLICPGVDNSEATQAGLPDICRDAVLAKPLVTVFLSAYLNGLDPSTPVATVSLLRADLAGLPPLVIDTGADDLIVGQARELAALARAAGIDTRYREHPGMWHVFHARPVRVRGEYPTEQGSNYRRHELRRQRWAGLLLSPGSPGCCLVVQSAGGHQLPVSLSR